MKSRNALLAAVVAVVIAVCLVGTFAMQDDQRDGGADDGQGGSQDPYRDNFPDPITDGMRDRAPADEVSAELEDSIDSFVLAAADGDPTAISDAVSGFWEDYCWYEVQYAVLYYYYTLDAGTYGDEYVAWTSLLNEADADWTNAVIDAMDGESATYVEEAVDAVLGEGTTDAYLESGAVTQEETDLLQRQSELESMYYNAWDPHERGQILLDLIDVRNRLAEIYGYDSYADYAYSEIYYRDYSPEDVESVREAVKTYMVPLMFDVQDALATADVSYSYDGVDQLYADVSPFLHSVSDGFGDLYDYMLDNDLIDFSDVPTKSGVGYTQYLDAGGTRLIYIFNDPYLNYNDATTLVHEFGHAAAIGLNETLSPVKDISETQSQGLEALFALSPLNPIGSTGDTALSFLSSMLSCIVDGCIFDDFQQRAYVSGAETPEDLDALFLEIEGEYDVFYSAHWSVVPHTFDEPFYYISYCTSAFSSLGIFTDALSDYDDALREYMEVNRYVDGSYRAMVADLGLLDIFDADDVRFVAETIASSIGQQVPAVTAPSEPVAA